MVITMAKLRMAHASTHGTRKPPGPKERNTPGTAGGPVGCDRTLALKSKKKRSKISFFSRNNISNIYFVYFIYPYQRPQSMTYTMVNKTVTIITLCRCCSQFMLVYMNVLFDHLKFNNSQLIVPFTSKFSHSRCHIQPSKFVSSEGYQTGNSEHLFILTHSCECSMALCFLWRLENIEIHVAGTIQSFI